MVISLWYLASRVTTRNGGKVAMPLSSLDVQIDGLLTVCIVYRLFNVCYQVYEQSYDGKHSVHSRKFGGWFRYLVLTITMIMRS